MTLLLYISIGLNFFQFNNSFATKYLLNLNVLACCRIDCLDKL